MISIPSLTSNFILAETPHLKEIAVTEGGSGYTSATVVITPASGARAVAVISGGVITAVRVVQPGAGFSAIPDITFEGTGTGAAAHAILQGGAERYDNVTVGMTPTGTVAEPVIPNTFAVTDPRSFSSYAVCEKRGMKILQARKHWHGRFGFLYQNCCEDEAGVPVSKYLTMTRESTLVYIVKDWRNVSGVKTLYLDARIDATMRQTFTVDRFSGRWTQTACTKNYVTTYTVDPGTGALGGQFHAVPSEPQLEGLAQIIVDCQMFPAMANINDTPRNAAGLVTHIEANSHSLLTGLDELVVTFTGSAAINEKDWHVNQTWVAQYDTLDGLAEIQESCVVDVTATLGGAYTSEQLNEDVDALFAGGGWDLANDMQYPWRTDDDCTTGPLLTYNEARLGGTPDHWEACGATDTSDLQRTDFAAGAIIGSPNPVGYDPHWDFTHENWDAAGTPLVWSITNYGRFSPFPHATQWSNNREAQSYRQGAWAAYNTIKNESDIIQHPNQLMKQIHAETILSVRPAHNWSRPCGAADKAAIDQDTIICIAGVEEYAGSPRWQDVPCLCKNPNQTTDCENPVPPLTRNPWNTTATRGDYLLHEWRYNFRDFGKDPAIRPVTAALFFSSSEQKRIILVPCKPAAVFLAPIPISYGNAHFYLSPPLVCDECYGSLWQQSVQQQMADPLWQPKARPCDWIGTWTEDGGSGTGDFAMRPWEEARLGPPEGAPPLPLGTTLRPRTIDDQNFGINEGVDYNPPLRIGQTDAQINNCDMPHAIYLRQVANVNAGGLYSADYVANGVPAAIEVGI